MPSPTPSPQPSNPHQQHSWAIAFFYALGLVFASYGIGIYLGMPDILNILAHPITSVAIAHDNGQRLVQLGGIIGIIGGINHFFYGPRRSKQPPKE